MINYYFVLFLESNSIPVTTQVLVDFENLIKIPKSQKNYSGHRGRNNNKKWNNQIAFYFKVNLFLNR